MSISTLDSPVPSLPTLDTSPLTPQANRTAPSTPSFEGKNQANVSYQSREQASGPVFGDHQPPVNRGGDHRHALHNHNPLATASVMHRPSFLDQFKQWISQWFGWRPPYSSAPSRPSPAIGRPHPQPRPDYASQSHEQLTQALLDNFKAFTGSHHSSFMTSRDIRAMANRQPGNDPVMNNNIRLAKELLNRPDLMQALDRNDGTGATDGRFSKRDLRDALNDTNYFRYQSDKEIAKEMLSHFNDLPRDWRGRISVKALKRLANQPLTGDSRQDHLIQLAQAFLSRGNMLKAMDRNGDGHLSKIEIQRLSR